MLLFCRHVGGQVIGKFMDARAAFIGFLASKGIEESMATSGVDMLFYGVATLLLFLVSRIALRVAFSLFCCLLCCRCSKVVF